VAVGKEFPLRTDLHWLLAYTKPKSEQLAEEHLRRQGFEVVCPLIRVQKLRRRKWTWLEEPLFPRYLFVGAPDGHAWSPIRSTVGVTSLVRFGGVYAAVPPVLIETLLEAAAEQPQPQRAVFQQGQKVKIVAGQFASLEAVFEMVDGADRATVLLDLLGRQSRVRVDLHQLVVE
jgi:transcriptional antiterminator RfaH